MTMGVLRALVRGDVMVVVIDIGFIVDVGGDCCSREAPSMTLLTGLASVHVEVLVETGVSRRQFSTTRTERLQSVSKKVDMVRTARPSKALMLMFLWMSIGVDKTMAWRYVERTGMSVRRGNIVANGVSLRFDC
jgi:hypothetical protein